MQITAGNYIIVKAISGYKTLIKLNSRPNRTHNIISDGYNELGRIE